MCHPAVTVVFRNPVTGESPKSWFSYFLSSPMIPKVVQLTTPGKNNLYVRFLSPSPPPQKKKGNRKHKYQNPFFLANDVLFAE